MNADLLSAENLGPDLCDRFFRLVAGPDPFFRQLILIRFWRDRLLTFRLSLKEARP